MAKKTEVEEFLSQRTLAVVGVSHNRSKFGNMVYRELKSDGYRVLAVNPNSESIEGDPCYPNLKALPEKVDGVVIILPPAQSEKIVQEANEAGIRRIWLQQGAESPAAVRYCTEHGMTVISGECILMYPKGTPFFHKFHAWFKQLFGQGLK